MGEKVVLFSQFLLFAELPVDLVDQREIFEGPFELAVFRDLLKLMELCFLRFLFCMGDIIGFDLILKVGK